MNLGSISRFFALFFFLFTFALPASADIADKVFDLLKSKGSLVGLNPDGVEMARYTYYNEDNGNEVLKRAAEEDYPFFALVGAAKLAKGEELPKLKVVFTEKICLIPASVIDDVFSKASGLISDAAAKQKVAAAIADSQGYSEAYFKENLESAKTETNKKLMANVPYFKDIPLICNFAFHTDFKIETDLKKLAVAKIKQATAIYKAFKNKDITKGASLLVNLGFSADIACDIVDAALDSEGLGAIPGVSELSNGLCKGFLAKAGKVLGKGASAVKKGACAVYDFFGGSCNDDVKSPPTGIQSAKSFCDSNGGLFSFSSKTNKANDYDVICKNGMACRAKPLVAALQCTTNAQAAQKLESMIADSDKSFNESLKAYSDKFKSDNIQTCPDKTCEGAMGIVLLNSVAKLKQLHGQKPLDRFVDLYYDSVAKDEASEIAKVRAETEQRSVQINQSITSNASDAMETILVNKWSKECPNQDCIDNVKTIAKSYAAEAKKYQKDHPEMSALAVQGVVGKKYAVLFKNLIDGAKKDALAANASVPATDQLHALGCMNFLGRADQYVCDKQHAYDVCVDRVKKGQAKLCLFGGKSYGELNTVISLLANQGCKGDGANGGHLTCKDDKSRVVCQRYADSGMPITCQLAANTGAPIGGVVPGQLAQDCKNYLGRPDQLFCTSEQGFQTCVGKVKAKQVALCFGPNKTYGEPYAVIKFLGSQGCQSGGSNGALFTCANPQGKTACQRFVAGGLPLTCN